MKRIPGMKRAVSLDKLRTIVLNWALKLGLAGKVRQSLDAALELEPKHAEAHTALALYHGAQQWPEAF